MISRVFQKTSGGKKVHISGLMRMASSAGNELPPAALPPLMDHSPYAGGSESESGHVHCFSNTIHAPVKIQENFINTNPLPSPCSIPFDSFSAASAFPWGQYQFPPVQTGTGFQFPASVPDPSVLRTFLASYGHGMINNGFRSKKEIVSVSQETVMSNENSSVVSNIETGKRPFDEEEEANPVQTQDLDCIWSY